MPRADDMVREALRRWMKDMKAAGKPITQPALGRRLGWTQPEVSNYLRGHLNADLEKVILIAQLLGTTVDALVQGSVPPLPEGAEDWMAAWTALSTDEESREGLLALAWRLAQKSAR